MSLFQKATRQEALEEIRQARTIINKLIRRLGSGPHDFEHWSKDDPERPSRSHIAVVGLLLGVQLALGEAARILANGIVEGP